MDLIDPTTSTRLPPDSIQRILFLSPTVHVYNPPPPASSKGHIAASWTSPVSRQIFTARLRILETAIPTPQGGEKLKADILLEDPKTGELFAAAPYTTPAVVEQVADSSRFFAVRVQDPSGRKAGLGIGFEERSDAFDFSVALQEIRKTLGLDVVAGDPRRPVKKEADASKVERDFSLKEGQTITVNLGGKTGKGRRSLGASSSGGGSEAPSSGGFSLPPPPNAQAGFLPPPPSAQDVKAQKRLSQTQAPPAPGSIGDLGFDDGEFGEFQ
ncbi:hypothetical protein VE00_06713 [Pseudogymnoascus sp. WSF 3629]|jgi:hypothetical protein|nr:hypothetical protein VE00_06713 [Pseudogymnoascus sp. WSF 3629]